MGSSRTRWWVGALAAAAVLAVPLPTVFTAGVRVPDTYSGRLTVRTVGAELVGMERTVVPGTTAVAELRVTLRAVHGDAVRVRLGNSGWTDCVSTGPAGDGTTGYACPVGGAGGLTADTWIMAGHGPDDPAGP
jgi:hypothetical protein